MRRIVGALVLTSLAASLAVPAEVVIVDPVQTRVFEVRYRTLSDASEIVGGVLSLDGSLKLKPAARTLVVEDHASNLVRVESMLRDFDLPPRNLEVTLTLLLGTDIREQRTAQGIGPADISREIRGIHETLGDFTKWTNYELLGSQSVTVVEGHSCTLALSDEYRVILDVDSLGAPTAAAPQGMVRFRSVVLQRISHTDSGEERADPLYKTEIQLQVGKLLTVGAARSPESRKALFLTIKARPI